VGGHGAFVPDAPSDEQELRELRTYLATWRAARDTEAEIVDS